MARTAAFKPMSGFLLIRIRNDLEPFEFLSFKFGAVTNGSKMSIVYWLKSKVSRVWRVGYQLLEFQYYCYGRVLYSLAGTDFRWPRHDLVHTSGVNLVDKLLGSPLESS